MNIAVIMSGIIKRYEHLEDLKDVFASTESRFNFKIFGQCYDFLGNPLRCRDQIEYGAEERLDMNYLSKQNGGSEEWKQTITQLLSL